MRRTLLSFTLLLFAYLLLADLTLSSCATRSSPGGGPRDTLAPRLDTSFPPNLSLNFKANEVRLLFNEYIVVKGGPKQINMSPPLEEPLEIDTRGRQITLRWKDTLAPNTTYTISFGNAITDFTEGNENSDFKYIFSTGDYIDSLSLQGQVIDARSAKPQEKMLVALYEIRDSLSRDSLPFLKLPTYYAYTDEEGRFDLNYMKYGRFLALAFNDARGNFKLNSGREKLAFHPTIIETRPEMEDLRLLASEPKPNPRFLGARQSKPGLIQLAFNYPLENYSLKPMLEGRVNWSFQQLRPGRDTLDFWFLPLLSDSLNLLFQDSVLGLDTVIASLREMPASKLQLNPAQKAFRIMDPLVIKSTLPIDSVDPAHLLLTTEEDTLNFSLTASDPPSPLQLMITPAKASAKYNLRVAPVAIYSRFGSLKDTALLSMKALNRQELGNVIFKVRSEISGALVLVIENPKEKEILRRSFRDSTTVNLRHVLPGAYSARLIVDANDDGEWSAGDFASNRQPEKIIPYQEKIDVRANWDLELEWIAKEAPASTVKSEVDQPLKKAAGSPPNQAPSEK